MFDFLYQLHTLELAYITVMIGVLMAAMVRKFCGVRPGGTLGAAIIILAASDSIYWALTLLIITPLISKLYSRLFGNRFRGREPMFVMAGMSIFLLTLCGLLLQSIGVFPISSLSFPLGMIFPAITASVMRKQGVAVTYRHLALAVVLTLEILIIIYAAGRWLNYDFQLLSRLAEPRQTLQLSWSALFAMFSIVIGFFTYRRYQIKAVGFITLPLLATIAIVSPINFLLILAAAVVVYLLTMAMRRASLMTNADRYVFITIVSVAVVWTIDYVLLHYTSTFSPFLGTGLFAALAVSVMVAEHAFYGIRRTFPLFLISLVAMIVIQISVSLAMNAFSSKADGLHYYFVRQATTPDNQQQ